MKMTTLVTIHETLEKQLKVARAMAKTADGICDAQKELFKAAPRFPTAADSMAEKMRADTQKEILELEAAIADFNAAVWAEQPRGREQKGGCMGGCKSC